MVWVVNMVACSVHCIHILLLRKRSSSELTWALRSCMRREDPFREGEFKDDRWGQAFTSSVQGHNFARAWEKENKVRDSNCWSMEVPDGSPCITDSQQSWYVKCATYHLHVLSGTWRSRYFHRDCGSGQYRPMLFVWRAWSTCCVSIAITCV